MADFLPSWHTFFNGGLRGDFPPWGLPGRLFFEEKGMF